MSTADFFERRHLRDWETHDAAVRSAVDSLRERGATFFRASLKNFTQEIIIEGWIEPPSDQGDLPL